MSYSGAIRESMGVLFGALEVLGWVANPLLFLGGRDSLDLAQWLMS